MQRNKITMKMLAEYLGTSYDTVKQWKKDRLEIMMVGFKKLIEDGKIQDPRKEIK